MLTAKEVRKLPYHDVIWVFPQPHFIEKRTKALEECFVADGGVLPSPPLVIYTPTGAITAGDYIRIGDTFVSTDIVDAGLLVATPFPAMEGWIDEKEFPHEELLGDWKHFVTAHVTFNGATKELWKPLTTYAAERLTEVFSINKKAET